MTQLSGKSLLHKSSTAPPSTFAPQVDFCLDWRGYTIRTARDAADLEQVQRLRYSCFQATWPDMPDAGIDHDDFDVWCEHLLILDKAQELIGTLRMNCRNDPAVCYSATEFDLGDFWSQPGVKIEMGRTCLAAGARAGFGLIALGHGLGKLVDVTGAALLFGCTSIETEDPNAVAALQAHFRLNGAASLAQVQPRAAHRLPGLATASAVVDPVMIERLLPPLLKGYLRAGAQVAPEPSHDPHFRCVDFFTVLDLSQQVPDFMAHYAPNRAARAAPAAGSSKA